MNPEITNGELLFHMQGKEFQRLHDEIKDMSADELFTWLHESGPEVEGYVAHVDYIELDKKSGAYLSRSRNIDPRDYGRYLDRAAMHEIQLLTWSCKKKVMGRTELNRLGKAFFLTKAECVRAIHLNS